MKNPLTPAGIDPATFRFVAQHLNHCATAVSINVPAYNKGDKTDFSNYRGKSLLTSTYKILFNSCLPRLTPYAEEITGDQQRGFRCNRSTTDHTFCSRQILEKKSG